MKSKCVFVAALALLLGACDTQEPAQPSVPAEQTATTVAEPPVAPAVEQVMPVAPAPAETTASMPEEIQQATVVTSAQPMSGEAIYKKTCMGCHATGAAKAPKVGDKAAWQPRIAKGMDVLLQSAINGVPGTAMMKRGTCASCSDADLQAAVEYMVSQSR